MRKNILNSPNWLIYVFAAIACIFIWSFISDLIESAKINHVEEITSIFQAVFGGLAIVYVIQTFSSQQKQINEQRTDLRQQKVETTLTTYINNLNVNLENIGATFNELKLREDLTEECKVSGYKYLDKLYVTIQQLHEAMVIDAPEERFVMSEFNRLRSLPIDINDPALYLNIKHRRKYFLFEAYNITRDDWINYRNDFRNDKSKFLINKIEQVHGNQYHFYFNIVMYAVDYLKERYNDDLSLSDGSDESKVEINKRYHTYVKMLKASIPKQFVLFCFYKLLINTNFLNDFILYLLFADLKDEELFDRSHDHFLPPAINFPGLPVTQGGLTPP